MGTAAQIENLHPSSTSLDDAEQARRDRGQELGVTGDELDLEFTAGMAHLHALGQRAGGEFLSELGARRIVRTETDLLLRRSRRLDPVVIAALGGDRFAAAPLRVILGGRR
jgi:hypothetical protein